MAKVKELLETLDDMRKVYQFDDEKTDIIGFDSDSIHVKTVDNGTGVVIDMKRDISRGKSEETLKESDLEELHDYLLRWSMVAVREEILQHGDLYNGFLASIMSVLKPREKYFESDGTFKITTDRGADSLAIEILNRIIGEE